MASEIKWIKITTDMFEDEKIDYITSLPEADSIIVIWVRLLTMAGKCNAGGYIFLTENIPYTDDMLAHKFKKPLNVIRMALETFRRLEMIEMDDSGRLFFPNWEKHQNVEAMDKVREYERMRKAKQRSVKKQRELGPPQDNFGGTSPVNVPDGPGNVTVIEEDEDKDLDTSSSSSLNNKIADAHTEKIIHVYSKVFGGMVMKPLVAEYVSELLGKGHSEEFVKEVMYEMGESTNNPNLNYMKTIADRWESQGVHSRYDARKAETLTIQDLYKRNIGNLSTTATDLLESMKAKYSEEWVRWAIIHSADNDVKHVSGILDVLKRWKKSGYPEPWKAAEAI